MENKEIKETVFFPQLCWETNILDTINNEELINFAYETQEKDEGITISNSLGYHSSYLNVSNGCDDRLKSLLDEIIPLVRQIIEDKFYIDPKSKVFSIDSWININPKYSYNNQHTHGGNVLLSIVYYAKVPKDSGNFYFKLESSKADKINSLGIDKSNIFSTYREFLPQKGDLLIFPGWVDHGVNQNISEEDRISYAFNCKVKNQLQNN